MKRNFLIIISIVLCLNSVSFGQYQLANSAKITTPGFWQIGVNPYTQIYKGDNSNNTKFIGSNLYIGHGISKGIDLQMKLGILNTSYEVNTTKNESKSNYYFGIDIEKKLISTSRATKPGWDISITGGLHSWKSHAGLDLATTFSRRTGEKLFIFFGADADINIEEKTVVNKNEQMQGNGKQIKAYAWIPIGVELYPNKKMSIIFEGNIPVMPDCHYVLGAGINVFFGKKKH